MTMIYLVLFQVAVFVALVLGIKHFLLQNTLRVAAKLRDAEADLSRKEEAVRKRIEDNEAEFRRKSAESQDALVRARETMEKEVSKSRDTLLEEARKERDRILDEATRNKEKLRQELVREAQIQTLDHAGRVYEMVFSSEIGRTLDRAFLDELFAALDEMDASNLTISAPAIEVVSSHPMEMAQIQRLKELVLRKFEVKLEVRETVAPELIAGIRIKLGSLEIDGSLKNRFSEAIEQLKGEHR
jgi:hypothetical protein